MIRTTLALDPEILQLVRSLSADRGIGLGDAVNQVLRRGLDALSPTIERNGFMLFAQASPASFGSDDVEKRRDPADQFFSRRQ